MEIKGTLRPGELLSAQWLHMKPRRSLVVIGVLLLVLFTGTLWFYLFQPLPESLDTVRWLFLGSVVYLLLLFSLWLPYKARRNYRQRKDLQREFQLTVTDSGLESRTENGYAKKPWSDYLKSKEGSGFFLLYLSDNLFQVIPKRFFQSSADIDTFREILKTKVGIK